MSAHEDGTPVVVATGAGSLRGRWQDGVARFAGVPYAAPPVGDLRFRAPAPVDPWTGERSAEAFGPICPQNPSMMDALFGGDSERWDEDCLYLNVWTPDPEAADTGPLPVMVWIHGGGFEMGSGSSPLYDGTHFASSGVVLVSLNYRLGAFGFLELGHLDADLSGSGNAGLLDQIAALEWVQSNIANFGGDAANVTVFGQSAGSMSISLLMASPRATGLFRRAITQSGAANAARAVESAQGDTGDFLAAGGWTSAADVRAAPTADLLAAHASLSGARVADPEAFIRRAGTPLGFLAFRPVADGVVVPSDPLAAYRDEYPDASLADLDGALLTDMVFRIPTVRLVDAQSAHAPTFQYLWDWKSDAFGGMIGAAHAIDIPFVFDLLEDHRLHVFVGADAPRSLARATNEAWIAFASTGVPAADGLAEWPTIDSEATRPVMVLDTEPSLADDPNGDTRRFWDATGSAMPASAD